VVRIEGYTPNGAVQGIIETAPFREVYMWPAQGTRTVSN
jgi:hypothetical protein